MARTAGQRHHRHQRGDGEYVEQDRCRRRRGEAVERVQDPAEQRHQGQEQEIGEGDAAQLDRQIELLRVRGKSRCQQVHEPGHGRHGGRRKSQQARQQHRQGLLAESPGGGLAVLLQAAREERHEGGVEGALAEQPAEQVGQAESHEKDVGDRPGAELVGDQDVAQETQHPADSGVAADRGKGTKERHNRE
jgi:hypothetical protein